LSADQASKGYRRREFWSEFWRLVYSEFRREYSRLFEKSTQRIEWGMRLFDSPGGEFANYVNCLGVWRRQKSASLAGPEDLPTGY